MDFGSRLKELRASKKLTQQQLEIRFTFLKYQFLVMSVVNVVQIEKLSLLSLIF